MPIASATKYNSQLLRIPTALLYIAHALAPHLVIGHSSRIIDSTKKYFKQTFWIELQVKPDQISE